MSNTKRHLLSEMITQPAFAMADFRRRAMFEASFTATYNTVRANAFMRVRDLVRRMREARAVGGF